MANNNLNRQSAHLENFGGLITLADPNSLPEGASPRNLNCDYTVGAVYTRQGLVNPFTYSGSSFTKNGEVAVDTPIGGVAWENPENVLVDTGVYASVSLTDVGNNNSSNISAGSSVGGGVPWTNPENIDSTSNFASVSLTSGGGGGGATYYADSTGSIIFNANSSNPSPPPVYYYLSGLPSVSETECTLYIVANGSVNAVEGGGAFVVSYSIDGGSTWHGIFSSGAPSFGPVTIPVTITGITNINQIQLQLEGDGACGPAGYVSIQGYLTSWYVVTAGSDPYAPALTAQTLQATMSGLSVPNGANITGIEVSFQGDYSATSPSVQASLNVGTAEPSFVLTTSPATYTFGGPGNLWGYSDWSNDILSTLVVNFYVSALDNSTINLNELSVTVYYTIFEPSSDALDITQFGYSIPSTSTPQGFIITFPAESTEPSTLTVQLMKAGIPVGASKTINVPTSLTQITLGDINDLWGNTWLYNDLNSTTFGIRIEANSESFADVYVGYVTITAYVIPSLTNFNYVTTFEDNFGNINTLAFDNNGQWWVENVLTNKGVLSPIFETFPNNFASSFSADGRQFIALSDLSQGTYPPQSYNSLWNDRVSQVGPGAPPSFTGTLSSGAVSNITSYSTASDVVTIVGPNTFTPGEVVKVNILTGPTFLNGGIGYNILGTGLTTSQFEIAYIGATGSGAATGTVSGQYTYPIVASPNGIIQYPFWNLFSDLAGNQNALNAVLWSAGPGTTSSGAVVTIYYLNAYVYQSGIDANLQRLMQQQLFPVYVTVSGTTVPIANGTFLVTNIGIGTPPTGGDECYYLTYTVSESGSYCAGNGGHAAEQPGQYQLTVATVTTELPLPGVQTGDQITLSGDTVAAWNSTWTVVDALNSGSFSVNQTSVASGVATYNMAYTGSTNTPPTIGQLITVTGCLNPAANFNITDGIITGVSWSGGTGTVQVSGFSVANAPTPVTEVGQATTSGTLFQIDSGPLVVGTTASAIYGDSGGGYVTLVGSSSIVVGTGTRRGVVFFITRNGYYTAPSPYVQFNVTDNTNYINATAIPLGPENVIARGIAFTEAGQDGVPGASYYTIPTPVQFTLNGVTYLTSSLIINDNITTTAQFTFPDTVLLEAEEIDIQGNDLFALQELGDSAWCTQYMGRSVWGRVNNKVTNFINLSFDGGYLPNPGSNLLPLGWGVDSSNLSNSMPTLFPSPIFGNSYYIKNQTGISQPILGMITQTAYQDQNSVAILKNSTSYSVRVTARTPSSATIGNLVIDLTSYDSGSGYGQTYGTYTLPTSSMTSNMVTYSGILLSSNTLTIPDDLFLRLYATNLDPNSDIEIDRVEIFPTLNPVNYTGLTISYKNDWESFDGTTGGTDTSTINNQPANGGFTMHDKLYILKESSMGYLSDSPNQEPANWNPFREVSNVAGACGINAYDVGEEWAVMACQNGLFAFNGGAPVPIQLEIPDIWEIINWNYGQTICVRNDTANRRIYIAAPIPTPNKYMPNAPSNSNPTTPNVIIMLNYKGIGTIEQLISSEPLHVTLMGKVVSNDLRRKWSPWTIQSPYFALIKRSELDNEMVFCNGISSSKLYMLVDLTSGNDDGVPFTTSYCTYGAVSTEIEKANPTFGDFQKKYVYASFILTGSNEPGNISLNQANGPVQMTFYQNTLNAPYPYVVPGGCDLSDPNQNYETNLDEYAMRLFTEVSVVGGWFNLSRETLTIQADGWAPVRGRNG